MNRYYEHPTEKNFRSPVYNVRAVPVEKIVANSYNPNVVAPPEMKLLELSIWEDGYDAVRAITTPKGLLRTGGRLPPLSGAQNLEAHLTNANGAAARHRDRKGPFEPHGLDHPPGKSGAGNAQRRADERDRRPN